jgi:hypothetical protein
VKCKINGEDVDVLNPGCARRSCFHRYADQGTFVQGRGYVSTYRDGPKLVCGRRHLHGCPSPIPAPEPCCTARDLPPINPRAPQWRRRCRACGGWTSTSVEERRAAVEAVAAERE